MTSLSMKLNQKNSMKKNTTKNLMINIKLMKMRLSIQWQFKISMSRVRLARPTNEPFKMVVKLPFDKVRLSFSSISQTRLIGILRGPVPLY